MATSQWRGKTSGMEDEDGAAEQCALPKPLQLRRLSQSRDSAPSSQETAPGSQDEELARRMRQWTVREPQEETTAWRAPLDDTPNASASLPGRAGSSRAAGVEARALFPAAVVTATGSQATTVEAPEVQAPTAPAASSHDIYRDGRYWCPWCPHHPLRTPRGFMHHLTAVHTHATIDDPMKCAISPEGGLLRLSLRRLSQNRSAQVQQMRAANCLPTVRARRYNCWPAFGRAPARRSEPSAPKS